MACLWKLGDILQTLLVDQFVGESPGNYRVEQLLGSGRLSAVYLARHPERNRLVAITIFIVPEQLSAQARQRFISRFNREASALVTLNHPHLLPVYDYGEYRGYPYIVTPYETEGSLATILKQQGQCSPAYALAVLEQVAAGLDYAHSNGVIHGALKPSNILMRSDGTAQVVGLGLMRIVEMRGIESNNHPYAHLLSIAGTFLGAPEYVAPEFVQGQHIDGRADIYALGIMLFELLTGKPPFSGTNPVQVAVQHVQQPLPSLHALRPDLPADFDLVLNQALARNPTQRFQHAGELVAAAKRALKAEAKAPVAVKTAHIKNADSSLSISADEEQVSTGKWQLLPPILTAKLPAVADLNPPERTIPSRDHAGQQGQVSQVGQVSQMSQVRQVDQVGQTDSWQFLPPIITGQLPAVAAPASMKTSTGASTVPQRIPPVPVPPLPADSLDGIAIDPFEWWASQSAATGQGQVSPRQPPVGSMPASRTGQLRGSSTRQSGGSPGRRTARSRKSGGMNRRQVVALLAGGAVTAGVVGFGGVSLAHMIGDMMHPQATQVGPASVTQPAPGSTPTSGTTSAPTATPTAGQPKTTPTVKATATTGPTPSPTATASQPTPTAMPSPTPSPPAHSGMVIGHTNQAINTAQGFTNPADGHGSLLVHLPNSNFVAYEKACTHEGVAVYYDGNSHLLVCPAHGAQFDPANGGKVVQGPANSPLPNVAIRVNADGSITTG